MTEVLIDPSRRTAGNLTYSGFSHVVGPMPREGDQVSARHGHLVTSAKVERIEPERQLVWMSVDWSTLSPENGPDV